MKIISHRGLVDGPNKELENNPHQILKMLEEGFDVEIDVNSSKSGELYLGHDDPEHQVTLDFLKQPGLWCHAKDAASLSVMIENGIHCFWHQEDDYTITSEGIIWAYPGKQTTGHKTILLYPEKFKEIDHSKYYGICTDYPYKFIKKGENK